MEKETNASSSQGQGLDAAAAGPTGRKPPGLVGRASGLRGRLLQPSGLDARGLLCTRGPGSANLQSKGRRGPWLQPEPQS